MSLIDWFHKTADEALNDVKANIKKLEATAAAHAKAALDHAEKATHYAQLKQAADDEAAKIRATIDRLKTLLP